MRQIERTGAFKRQYKLMRKREKDEAKIRAVVTLRLRQAAAGGLP